jgi:hypothetical protein
MILNVVLPGKWHQVMHRLSARTFEENRKSKKSPLDKKIGRIFSRRSLRHVLVGSHLASNEYFRVPKKYLVFCSKPAHSLVDL